MNARARCSLPRIEAYAYDGCGQDSYVLLRQANITHHIGCLVQDSRVWISCGQELSLESQMYIQIVPQFGQQ